MPRAWADNTLKILTPVIFILASNFFCLDGCNISTEFFSLANSVGVKSVYRAISCHHHLSEPVKN